MRPNVITLVASIAVALSLVEVAVGRQLEGPHFGNESFLVPGAPKIEVADLNRDGRLDLVCVAELGGLVSVLRGDGFGGFTKSDVIDFGEHGVELAIGDVQGDGALDVVALLVQSSAVRVLLGDGLGNLTPGVMLSNLGHAQSLALGDVNGDGRDDLAICQSAKNVRIFRATAAGAFLANPIVLPTDASPHGVVVRDLDDDGHLDVACVSPTTGNVNVFTNTGNGTFGAAQSWFAGLSTERFSVDDLDADGVLDFICPRTQSTVLSVLFGLGGGDYANLTVFPMGTTPNKDATVVDFDGDGLKDVVFGQTQLLRLMRNGPPGVLSAPELLSSQLQSYDVVAGDFDGDLDQDLAIGMKNLVHIAENLGDATIPQLPEFAGPLPIQGAAFADVDVDGAVDQVACVKTSAGLVVQFGDGAGSLGASVVSSLPGGTSFELRLADLDGDAVVDALATESLGFHVAHGNGNGQFTAIPQGVALAQKINDHEFADIDNDGDLDVYFASGGAIHAYVNQGSGAFVAGGVTALFGAVDVVASDLTQDGCADTTAMCGDQKPARIALADGSGGFAQVVTVPLGMNADAGVYSDVDADGMADLVVHRSFAGSVGVLKRVGATSFQAPVLQTAPPLTALPLMATDLDGNGVEDLVGLMLDVWTPEHLVFFRGTGGTTLGAPRAFSLCGYGASLAVFDADGNGALDAALPDDPNATNLPSVTRILRSGCPGEIGAHGTPCPGTGGFTPKLAVLGCASPQQALEVRLVDALGGSFALLFAGIPGPSLPIGGSGCFLHLDPSTQGPIVVPLQATGAGMGSAQFAVHVPTGAANLTTELQAFIADGGAPSGFAATNAVTVVVR